MYASFEGNRIARQCKCRHCHDSHFNARYGDNLNLSRVSLSKETLLKHNDEPSAMPPRTPDNPATLRTTRCILIVDDHSLLRDGIKQALSAEPSYRVIGETANGLEVRSACQALRPDIVILDLALPGMNGIEVIRQLKQRWPELIVVVLTADRTELRAREALDAGAKAYVLKAGAKDTLLIALRAAVRGETFLDPALDPALVRAATDATERAVLTARERQILQLVAEGARNRDIAQMLSISIKTVETHRLNLMRKLNVHKAVELANCAHRLGFVVSASPDTPPSLP
jgi:two-component system secretion response regulator SsrB